MVTNAKKTFAKPYILTFFLFFFLFIFFLYLPPRIPISLTKGQDLSKSDIIHRTDHFPSKSRESMDRFNKVDKSRWLCCNEIPILTYMAFEFLRKFVIIFYPMSTIEVDTHTYIRRDIYIRTYIYVWYQSSYGR